MPMIIIVENFSLDGWGFTWNVGLNYHASSKCKPNKGVVTRKSRYCHKCVITVINNNG